MNPVMVRRPRTLSTRRPIAARRHVALGVDPFKLVIDNPAPWPLILATGVACVSVFALSIVGFLVLGDPTAMPTPTPGLAPVAPGWLQ